jgi:hypothetical protein
MLSKAEFRKEVSEADDDWSWVLKEVKEVSEANADGSRV